MASRDKLLSTPKWTLKETSALSTITREELFKTMRANLDRFDDSATASELSSTRTMELFTAEDARETGERIFARFGEVEGRKLYASAEIAVSDYGDLYELRPTQDLGELPEGVLGDGDNAFRTDDVEGRVMVIREVEQVDALMRDGVPEGTIAVIDDAGGTLTAPILEDFDGVLCMAGTVRSHLAIISREFGVPCLMNVRFARALQTGERVRVRYSSEAQSVDAYHGEDDSDYRRAQVLPDE